MVSRWEVQGHQVIKRNPRNARGPRENLSLGHTCGSRSNPSSEMSCCRSPEQGSGLCELTKPERVVSTVHSLSVGVTHMSTVSRWSAMRRERNPPAAKLSQSFHSRGEPMGSVWLPFRSLGARSRPARRCAETPQPGQLGLRRTPPNTMLNLAPRLVEDCVCPRSIMAWSFFI